MPWRVKTQLLKISCAGVVYLTEQQARSVIDTLQEML